MRCDAMRRRHSQAVAMRCDVDSATKLLAARILRNMLHLSLCARVYVWGALRVCVCVYHLAAPHDDCIR